MYPWHATFHMGIVHFMAYPQVKTEDEILKSVHKILNDDFFQAIEVNMLYEDNILEKISALCETADVEFLLGHNHFFYQKRSISMQEMMKKDTRRFNYAKCKLSAHIGAGPVL